jgi:hypothetical protein
LWLLVAVAGLRIVAVEVELVGIEPDLVYLLPLALTTQLP